MSALPWILGGGALAYAATRMLASTHGEPDAATNGDLASTRSPSQLDGSWVWPMPRWNGRPPTISDGFSSPRPGGIRHGGVDLMFARVASDPFKVGSPNGTKAFVMPDHMLALAAGDGRVRYAASTPRGLTVQLEHDAGKVVTYYTHLDELLVQRTTKVTSGEHVRAGQPIGVIGSDPQDGEHIKHLHFEIWLPPGAPKDRIDPAPVMRAWPAIGDPGALVARNGSLVYRAIGESGGAYPDWIRALKEKAGVYVIRDRESHEILYVGSSATQLYDTLTRHFQQWRRYKSFWSNQYAEGHDPGLTYERSSVEVAVRLTTATRSLDQEMKLIARLQPRDNVIGQPTIDLEEVPF